MVAAFNIVLFQLGWFACVLGAAHGLPWLGALVAVAISAGWILRARHGRGELLLAGAAVLLGLVLDTALLQSGWIRFSSPVPLEALAPAWMLALWMLFAVTLNVSLRRLRDRPALGAVLGALGGPAAYYAGGELGALRLEQPAAGLAAVAVGWALATPLLFALARRLETR